MAYLFTTTKTYDSTRLPGVRLTLRKMTEDRRLKLQFAISKPNEKIRNCVAERRQLLDANGDQARIAQLNDEINTVITQELNPAKVKWAVARIEGLVIDQVEATVDSYFDWPSDLVEELIDLIDAGTILNETQQGNSESPTTPGAQA